MTRALENIQIEKLEQDLNVRIVEPLGISLLDSLSTRHEQDKGGEFFPLHPDWNLVIHKQWVDRRKVFTVTVSLVHSPDEMIKTPNSVSARGPCFHNVLVATMMRAEQWLRDNE